MGWNFRLMGGRVKIRGKITQLVTDNNNGPWNGSSGENIGHKMRLIREMSDTVNSNDCGILSVIW